MISRKKTISVFILSHLNISRIIAYPFSHKHTVHDTNATDSGDLQFSTMSAPGYIELQNSKTIKCTALDYRNVLRANFTQN